jgi:GNAT superfamily N-acetyltransferase
MPDHRTRLLQLAEEVFAVRSDPEQLDVDERVLERLRRLHPASVQEEAVAEGPVAWVLLIPTTRAMMDDFVAGRITERALYERTPEHGPYQAVYLCSGLVLPEYRRRGIAARLAVRAVEAMRRDHPIAALCSWAFTPEGQAAARALAVRTGLPLHERTPHQPAH